MNEQEQRARFQRSIDARLSGLEGDPYLAQRILASAKGEKKVKKKLSVGFVVLMVLVLAVATALAATLIWQQQVVPMKQLEQTQGEYAQWTIQQKQELIRVLIDTGSIPAGEETARLLDEGTPEGEKHALADQLMLALTEQTDVNEINVDIITYAVMGSTDTWTPEQRVWWQQVTNQFRNGSTDPDTLVSPTGREPTEAEAVALAKAAIIKAFELAPDALDQALPVANLYVTDERPDYRRWDVQFKFIREGTKNYVERVYCAIVDENGSIIADPDVAMPSVTEMAADAKARREKANTELMTAYQRYCDQGNSAPFIEWPIELKAAYSQEMRPLVEAAKQTRLLAAYDAEDTTMDERVILGSTTYAYGLPAQGDVEQEDALGRAWQTVKERFQQGEEDFPRVYSYYDVTNPDSPRWRFLFYPAFGLEEMHRVELDAKTGEVVQVETFPYRTMLETLEYDLKWY